MQDIKSYSDVLAEIKGSSNSLLLGNGFSMSYDKKRFSFTHLLDKAVEDGIIEADGTIHKVFKAFDLSDFEQILKILDNSAKVFDVYELNSKTSIKEDAKNLKKHLVNVVTNNHPDFIFDLDDNNYDSCIDFIKNYNKVYTLNYDLLLYWTLMKIMDKKEEAKRKNLPDDIILDISDGFGDSQIEDDDTVEYKNDSAVKQNIHFLHGALHIFDEGYRVIKKTFSRTQKPLKEQIYKSLLKNVYPVFISEGTSEQKLQKIIHNPYLNHSYKGLSKIAGNLIIFGTILKSNDSHILEAIKKSKLEKIFIGVYSSQEYCDFERLKTEIEKDNEKRRKPKFVFAYDSTSLNVWGKNNENK